MTTAVVWRVGSDCGVTPSSSFGLLPDGVGRGGAEWGKEEWSKEKWSSDGWGGGAGRGGVG